MFEIGLRRGVAALLQFIEIILDLFRIKFCRQAVEMKCERSHMPAVIIKASFAATQNGDVPFESLQQFGESGNLTTGPIEVFVIP